MDSGAFHVLHDPRNQHRFTVTDSVNLAFAALHVVVDQNLAFGCYFGGYGQITDQLSGIANYFHCPATQNITRTNYDRIIYSLGHRQRLSNRCYGRAGRLRNAEVVQEPFESLPIAGDIDSFGAGTQYRQTDCRQRLRQVDGRLPAELDQ